MSMMHYEVTLSGRAILTWIAVLLCVGFIAGVIIQSH